MYCPFTTSLLLLSVVKFLKTVSVVEKKTEAAREQLRLFSLTHRRIRGDLISMFNINHGSLEFPIESTFTHPTRKVLRGHDYEFHKQRCCTRRRQYAFSIQAEVVNTTVVKSFKTLLDAHWQSLFPEVPI